MSGKYYAMLALLASTLPLSACQKERDAAPSGQVVASVDGMEVTQRELAAEMDMTGGPASPEARSAALQTIVARKLLARQARKLKLNDSADYALLRQRADEAALETLLQRYLTRNLPDPTPEDAAHYVSANPDLFAQRKRFTVDQIRIAHAPDPAFLDRLKPLKTLDEIAALLGREGIGYQHGSGAIDALQSPPEMVAQILALPPGELFLLPSGGATLANVVRDIRTDPVPEAEARRFALDYLKQKAVADTLRNQVAEIVRKNRDRIRYQPGYAPRVADADASQGIGG